MYFSFVGGGGGSGVQERSRSMDLENFVPQKLKQFVDVVYSF